MRALLPILLLLTSLALPSQGSPRTEASPGTGTGNFLILANFLGWNSTDPLNGPTNPLVKENRMVQFKVSVEYDDGIGFSHDFAIYTSGFSPGSVSTLNICDVNRTTPGCLAKSGIVTASSALSSVSFTARVAADDFGGPGAYEYYCQFHATAMHGKISVIKNPVVDFATLANFSGWNSTTPSPNPSIVEFRGVLFVVKVVHNDGSGIPHDFAVYTKDFPSGSVLPSDPCDSARTTPGCLVRSGTVSTLGQTAAVNFTSAVPADDFTGVGGFEYYCQYHAGTMHGKISVRKNPDVNGDRVVDIVDVATAAFSFGSRAGPPPTSTWNVSVDLDNSGAVDIVDVAIAAFYFGRAF